jgi:hypothetical protein
MPAACARTPYVDEAPGLSPRVAAAVDDAVPLVLRLMPSSTVNATAREQD